MNFCSLGLLWNAQAGAAAGPSSQPAGNLQWPVQEVPLTHGGSEQHEEEAHTGKLLGLVLQSGIGENLF